MKFIHLVLVSILFVSCETRYYNNDLNISIKNTKDWEAHENYQGIPVFFMSPIENENDSFRENITIVSENAPSYSLTQYYQDNIKGIDKYLIDFKILEEVADIKINGNNFKKVTYEHYSQNTDLNVLVYFTVKKEKGYVISCTALDNTFDDYKKDFETLAESFKFE